MSSECIAVVSCARSQYHVLLVPQHPAPPRRPRFGLGLQWRGCLLVGCYRVRIRAPIPDIMRCHAVSPEQHLETVSLFEPKGTGALSLAPPGPRAPAGQSLAQTEQRQAVWRDNRRQRRHGPKVFLRKEVAHFGAEGKRHFF
eukprot:COSAG06_NODE_22726_length_714_cov_2.653659_2_plen_142_part_00